MHNRPSQLYIIIPAYNEEANIRTVVEDWYRVIERHDGDGTSRLVVIDDGSTDHTGSVLEKFRQNHPLLDVIHRTNAGHGPSVLYGYKYAVEHGADYVFQTDSDGQTLASEFEKLWSLRDKADMIAGWRRNRQDGADRVFVTKVLRLVVASELKAYCRDANVPYRLMHAASLRTVLPMLPDDTFLANVLVSAAFDRIGFTTLYVPVTFRERQGGVNSIDIRKICRVGMNALLDFRKTDRKWRENYKI